MQRQKVLICISQHFYYNGNVCGRLGTQRQPWDSSLRMHTRRWHRPRLVFCLWDDDTRRGYETNPVATETRRQE